MELEERNVSEKQGIIDWEKMRIRRGTMLMLRAGYGAGEIDVFFRRNAEACSKKRIPFGVYWDSYAYSTDMAEKEAEYCADTIEEYTLSGPVRFDFGEGSARYVRSKGITVDRMFVEKLAEAFCKRMGELGYTPAAGKQPY